MLGARQQYSTGRIQANTVNIWADGILEPYTAETLLDKAGFQVHIHATGDATVRCTLDAFEEAQNINGRRDSRHLTTHTQVVNPSDLGRFALLDVIAGFTPYWTYADSYVSDINLPQLGEKRMQQMYPIRSILDSGGNPYRGRDCIWRPLADDFLNIDKLILPAMIPGPKREGHNRPVP